MSNKNKKFDLIFSLGGSCASASQLKYRNLRYCSLPFDYFFTNNEETFTKLIECFKDDFKQFFLQKNLAELTGAERGNDNSGCVQYKDIYTGYRAIHLFKKPAIDEKEYNRVKKVLNRRINRLYKLLFASKQVMILLDTNHNVNISILEELIKLLKEKFCIEHIILNFVQFESKISELECIGDINIYKLTRERNFYDFAMTNYIWSFLDNIKVKKYNDIQLNLFKFPILTLKKIKKGLA